MNFKCDDCRYHEIRVDSKATNDYSAWFHYCKKEKKRINSTNDKCRYITPNWCKLGETE